MSVTATCPGGLNNIQSVNVTDYVTLETITWTPAATQRLKVIALTSDKIASNVAEIPQLTLRFGASSFSIPQSGVTGRYEISLDGIAISPAFVTVISSKGGMATKGIPD